jgi:hypothetical protein
MRVMIEIDLPDGQDIPRTEDIKRLTDPNWLASWWHISDVQSLNDELTEDECRSVLSMVDRKHDANIGINWDFIEYWIDEIIDEREKV